MAQRQPLIPFCLGITVAVVTLSAQTTKPTFEVVSIKRRLELLKPPITNVIKDGVFKMPEVNVATLLQFAWQIRDFQLVGGPQWIWSDWFEVEARAASNTTTREEMRAMVRSMLEDRFGLTIRPERREIPVFTLERAANEERLGPLLQPWDDCSKRPSTPRPSFPGDGTGFTAGGCGTLSEITIAISRAVDRPVIDATALSGTFQYAFHVPSDPETAAAGGLIFPRSRVNDALKEYLGLTLKDARRPFDVLVIDSVQPPTEN